MWVAEDGSYGSGQVVEFDTTNWTDEDFDAVENASDSERLAVAEEINHERNGA